MRENNIFNSPIKAVNIGAALLGEALQEQGIDVIMMDWRPPKVVNLPDRVREILRVLEENE